MHKPSFSLAQAAITKYHKAEWLTQEKLIFSQFWELEVQGQGTSRVFFL